MTCGEHRVDGVWEGRGAPADAIAASQKGRTPRTNAVGHHPEVVRTVGVDAVPSDLEHDLRLELIFSVGIQIILQRLQEARVRVLEGQDHGRLVGLVVVRLDRQLARAGRRDLMLNNVLLPRAREAREAPGGGRRECER